MLNRVKYVKVISTEKLHKTYRNCTEDVYITRVFNDKHSKKTGRTLGLIRSEFSLSLNELAEIRKECNRRGIKIEVMFKLRGYGANLKPYQTDKALEHRRVRKSDVLYCNWMKKRGEALRAYFKLIRSDGPVRSYLSWGSGLYDN